MLAFLFVFCVFTSQYVTFAQTCPRSCGKRMKKMTERIKELEASGANTGARINALETQVSGSDSSGAGAVYTRWGRTACPTDSTLLYDGFAGGASYRERGSGANYLCLPKVPQWGNFIEGVQNCGAFLYGAEYEKSCGQDDIYSLENNEDEALQNHDVPCAVCQATKRPSHVMIPAMVDCPKGWSEEYQGYIAASHHGQRRSEWVCMDKAPETLPDSQQDIIGASFYQTEVVCGSLQCPNYHDGDELSCVVCSK